MNKLRIPLSAVAGPKGFSFEEQVPEEALRPQGLDRSSLISVQIAGTVSPMGPEYLFTGTLSGEFEQPCDRCLEPARETVQFEVTWMFERGVESASLTGVAGFSDEDAFEEGETGHRVRFFEGDEIDLAPHMWEEMILECPSKYYCSEDCKGLCPQCGTNLNHGTCDCASERETSGSGLAGLKDMFPDLRSETPED